jgi:SCF-associated factor 1
LILKNDDLASRVRQGCEGPQPPIPAQEEDPVELSKSEPSTIDAGRSITQQRTWSDTIADYGRYFLGAPPYNRPNADEPSPHVFPPSRVVAEDEDSYITDGAHAREGVPYKWKGDHFPRLRLENGEEMPGDVPFDEWLSERPNFQLNEDEWT